MLSFMLYSERKGGFKDRFIPSCSEVLFQVLVSRLNKKRRFSDGFIRSCSEFFCELLTFLLRYYRLKKRKKREDSVFRFTFYLLRRIGIFDDSVPSGFFSRLVLNFRVSLWCCVKGRSSDSL